MKDLKISEAWRVFRIQAELIDGIELCRFSGWMWLAGRVF